MTADLEEFFQTIQKGALASLEAVHKGTSAALGAIHKGALASLEAVQKGTTATIGAFHKGTTVSVKAIQKSGTVSVNAIRKSRTVSIEAIQTLADIKGHPRSVLNGVIGDHLEAQDHRLAIEMELLGETPGRKLSISVHGLCDSEANWQFLNDRTRTYGSLLQKDFGHTPLYLLYNSGLHISTNGQKLAKLLSEIYEVSPNRVKEIIFIGHSMGGLVIRSACHYGQKAKAPWVKHVRKIFLLGTPHHGTDWEKIGNLTSTVLKKIPNLVTRGLAALGNKRSAGIKDLRFGYLLDEDWQGHDADALWQDNRHPVPLLNGADHYIITAILAKESDNIFAQYFGDGLVPTRSARGKHLKESKTIPFSPKHFKTFKDLSHVGLCHDRKVYRQIRKWCRS